MGINSQTNNFKTKLIAMINESGLPAVNVLYVMNDVLQEVQKEYQQAIIDESKSDEESE